MSVCLVSCLIQIFGLSCIKKVKVSKKKKKMYVMKCHVSQKKKAEFTVSFLKMLHQLVNNLIIFSQVCKLRTYKHRTLSYFNVHSFRYASSTEQTWIHRPLAVQTYFPQYHCLPCIVMRNAVHFFWMIQQKPLKKTINFKMHCLFYV